MFLDSRSSSGTFSSHPPIQRELDAFRLQQHLLQPRANRLRSAARSRPSLDHSLSRYVSTREGALRNLGPALCAGSAALRRLRPRRRSLQRFAAAASAAANSPHDQIPAPSGGAKFVERANVFWFIGPTGTFSTPPSHPPKTPRPPPPAASAATSCESPALRGEIFALITRFSLSRYVFAREGALRNLSPALCAGSARLRGLRPRRRSLQRFAAAASAAANSPLDRIPAPSGGAKFVGRAFARECVWGSSVPPVRFSTPPSHPAKTPSASSSICCNLVRIACAPRRDLALRLITRFSLSRYVSTREGALRNLSPALCAGSEASPGLRPRRRSLQRFCGGRLRGREIHLTTRIPAPSGGAKVAERAFAPSAAREFPSRPNPPPSGGARFVERAFARGCFWVHRSSTGTFSTPPSHPAKTPHPPPPAASAVTRANRRRCAARSRPSH